MIYRGKILFSLKTKAINQRQCICFNNIMEINRVNVKNSELIIDK